MHDALTDYPPTPLRAVLDRLLDADDDVRQAAYQDLRDMREYAPSEPEALALMELVSEVEFPPQESTWQQPAVDLLHLLWNAPYLALVEPVRESYAGLHDEELRVALLTLLASTRTRAGVQTFIALVSEHGWPSTMYPRVFVELAGNEIHAELIFPKLLELADEHLVDIGGIALRWMQNETLSPQRLAVLAPQLVSRLHALLDQARRFESEGIGWRFEHDYIQIRSRAGFLLDFLGWFDVPEVVPALERSMESSDPWLALFGLTSLLRLGQDVEDEAVERVAASHETRGHLWQYLENLGELHRYPNQWANLEDFAAFDMVQWLKYPTELGREPEELELMETFEGAYEGDPAVLYVWRFRGWDDDWMTSVSGPYRTQTVGPMAGPSTFSRFEPWESRSPEEHAQAALETLDD